MNEIMKVKRGNGNPEILFIKMFYRAVGIRLAGKLAKTRITPNQITILGFLFGIMASVLFSYGDYLYTIIGMFILQIYVVLDHADGFLARMKSMESRFGGFLDFAGDRIVLVLVFLGIGWGLYSSTGNILVWVLCFLLMGMESLYDANLLSVRLIFLPSSSKVLRETVNKKMILRVFIYTPFHIYALGLFMAFLNRMLLFLWISLIYLSGFYVAETLYFLRKFRKMDKKQ